MGRHPDLMAVLGRAQRIAATRVPLLITGETGTGKDLVARLVHDTGPRANRPYVAVNCGTLSRELADSALFGHERGAFTGATARKVGWFEEADGGTLVLDEIGELPIDLQSKLLRVLETGRLRRVGGAGEVAVDVRLVAVTWRDLRGEIDQGRFRADLFHRLSAFELTVPPLRSRVSDIPLLVQEFLIALEREVGPRTVEPAALTRLMAHRWPGNIRELRNAITRAAVLSSGSIGPAALDLPRQGGSGVVDVRAESQATEPEAPRSCPSPLGATPISRLSEAEGEPFLDGPRRVEIAEATRSADPPGFGGGDSVALAGRSLAEIERSVFAWALERNGGSRRRAARALSVPRSTFCDRARRYGLA